MSEVKYRLEVNYYSRDYEHKCCETSAPVYNLEDGIKEYLKEIQERCIDDKTKPARVHLWEYTWSGEPWASELIPATIAKNY